MSSMMDYIGQNFGVPSPGSVTDKLIAFFSKVRTGSGAPAGGLGVTGDFYFDITNGNFWSRGVSGWVQGVSGASSNIIPTVNNAMGASLTINAGAGVGATSAVFLGTLSAASCAITYGGFVLNQYSEILHYITGSAGKTATFTDTISWTGGYPPVFSTTGLTEFVVSSPDGVAKYGSHGQQTRVIAWGPGNDTTAVSAVNSPLFPVFKDARVVDGIARLVTAGTAQATIIDVLGNGTTLYTTQANRPTIATNGTSSGAVTLPNTTLLAPASYIQYSIAQFGTSAAGLSIAMKILELP